MIMDLQQILAVLTSAIESERTVTIKADEIVIKADEATASGLEITVEA